MAVIGLDIGTTGCKAIVFGDDWGVLGRASREYPIISPLPGIAEQDAQLVWDLAIETLSEAVRASAAAPRALALSVQGEAIIPVDGGGVPIRRAILGMDTRTGNETRRLAERFGEETLFARTGMPMHTMNPITKLLWLHEHEPAVWRDAAQFLLYEDYFLKRLGGSAHISHCLASRTQMYDLHTSGWADDMLAACDIDPRRLAQLAPVAGGPVGTLRRDVARRVGLSGEVVLVSGGHDQACASLGSGVTRAGLAMVSTGTAEVVEVALQSPTLCEALRKGYISIYRHVVPGLYLSMTLNHSGGLSLRWFRDTLCRDKMDAARGGAADAYDLILADAPAGPTDLMFLPHFCGAGTPMVDPTSKGAILGLSFATTQASLAKAVLEGLTFELRVNLDLLRDSGVAIEQLHAVGGGAKSALWLQLKADICGVPLKVPRVTEAACLGAGILAAVGAGVCPDVHSAVAAAVRFDRLVEPDAAAHKAYTERYALYRQLYPSLIALLRRC